MKLRNNKNLTFHKTESYEEWLDERLASLGGSDLGIILNLTDYAKSAAHLLYEKLGLTDSSIDSEAMFWGRALEPTVKDNWRFWGGSVKTMMENAADGVLVNDYYDVDETIRNSKYPYLHCNPDGIISKPPKWLRRKVKGEGILEAKTVGSMAADKWQNGMHPAYIAQVFAYMMVCELDYAVIIVLKDGRFFSVHEYYIDEPVEGVDVTGETFIISPEVLSKAGELFWKVVEDGRKIMMEAESEDERDSMLMQIEPEPFGMVSYEKFLSETFERRKLEQTVKPDSYFTREARKYKQLQAKIKALETAKRKSGQRMHRWMTKKEADVVDFEDLGRIKLSNKRLFVNVNL